MNKGKIFIVSAPSGSGKTTLVNMLCKEFPERVQETVSCTTRQKRDDEVQGDHYYFLTRDEFEHRREQGEFLEWAEIYGDLYGTLNSDVDAITQSGKHAILVIDTQGAEQLMESIDPVFVFIMPPSIEELEKRLKTRQTENEEMRKKRLEIAEKEISKSYEYDFRIRNDDLQRAYTDLKNIIIGEI